MLESLRGYLYAATAPIRLVFTIIITVCRTINTGIINFLHLLIKIYKRILSFFQAIRDTIKRTKNGIKSSFWSNIDRLKRTYYWILSLRRRSLELICQIRIDLLKFIQNVKFKAKKSVQSYRKRIKAWGFQLKDSSVHVCKDNYKKFMNLSRLNRLMLLFLLSGIMVFVILVIIILYDIHTDNLQGAASKWRNFIKLLKACRFYLKSAALFILHHSWMTLILLIKLSWLTLSTLLVLLYNIFCWLFANLVNCSKFLAKALQNLCFDFYEHGTVALFRAAISTFYFTKDFTWELLQATGRKSIDILKGTSKFLSISYDFTVSTTKTVADATNQVSQTTWIWSKVTFQWIKWFIIQVTTFIVYFFNEWAFDWIKFSLLSLYKMIYASLHIVYKFMNQFFISTCNFTTSFISHIYNGTYLMVSFVVNFFTGFTGATRGIANGLVFVIRGIFSTIVFGMESTVGVYTSTMSKYNNIRELIFIFAISLFCVYCSSLAYDRQQSKSKEEEEEESDDETLEKLYPVAKSKLMPTYDNPMLDESDTDSEIGFKDEVVPDINTETNSTDEEL
ncbi:unnamed protein product [Dimorphilus gyrociliatus]|uniref:Uncharacterized protein n=1 Tax=Dimorphilus gyrociliatus TaxID=2664684 RepID=A0A7I8VUM1_9ANNE|nr:unnamed protein product [Dimorphilus gyrociliatus]